jgi:hypothetical protein
MWCGVQRRNEAATVWTLIGTRMQKKVGSDKHSSQWFTTLLINQNFIPSQMRSTFEAEVKVMNPLCGPSPLEFEVHTNVRVRTSHRYV